MMSGQSESRRSGGILWPLLITLAIFGVFLYLAWLVWQQARSIEDANAAAQNRLVELREERDRLKGALELSPCEAKALLEGGTRKSEARESPPKAREPLPVAQTGPSTPENVENACVFIVSATGPKSLATGSGFFVAPGYVATNKHVVDKSKGKILVTSKAMGRPAFGEIIARSPDRDRDYALLKVDMPRGANVAVLNFAPEIKRTQKVGAWGFPDLVGKNDPGYARLMRGEDLSSVPELSYSEGVVSAVLDRNPRVIVHTAPISPGNSGGPLVNEKGEVVGINTMITLDEDSYRQASIALAAEDLARFLAEHGIEAGAGK